MVSQVRVRVRRLVVAALVAALAVLVVPSPLTGSTALADPRSQAQEDRDKAQSRQAELISSLEGVSAELGQAYLDLQDANDALSSAESDLAARQREEQTATDRLGVAQAQLDRLDEQAAASQAMAEDNEAAISSLVVSTYQGDSSLSAWTYVLASDSVEDLTQRASSMEVASGIQESVLAAADEQRAQDANRQARQQATTERIDALRQTAAEAAQAAQAQRDEVAARQAQAQAAADVLEQRKAAEEEQLRQAQADEEAANAKIAEIDAANRQAALAAGQTVASAGSVSASALGAGAIGHPITGPLVVASPYGYRIHPITGQRRLHAGVDLVASQGTPQYAAVSGTVTYNQNSSCGNGIMLNGGVINGQSVVIYYCHMSGYSVGNGARVSKGDQIGLTGMTGGATGPHVHFEVYLNGSSLDPMTLPGF